MAIDSWCRLVLKQKSCTSGFVYMWEWPGLTDLGLRHHCWLSVAERWERKPEVGFFVPLEIKHPNHSQCLKNIASHTHTHTLTLSAYTHHHHKYRHMLTLLSTGLGFVWLQPQVAFGPRMCFHSLSWFVTNRWDVESGARQCSSQTLFISHPHPQRQRPCESSHNNNQTDNEHRVD